MKRNLFKILTGIAFFSAVLIGCNKQQEVSTATTARIDGDDEVEIFVGDTAGFKFIISPADANAMVTWSSDDNGTKAKMLSVDSVFNTSHRYVKFVGLQPGEIKVYATVNGNPTLTDTCTLIVKPFPSMVDSVYLFFASDTLEEPIIDTIQIVLNFSDTLDFQVRLDGEWMSLNDAGDETSAELSKEWEVKDESIVAHSGEGVFVGLKEGETIVYISVKSKYKTSTIKKDTVVVDSCVVKVTKVES